MVEKGSVKRLPGSLEVNFTLTDYAQQVGSATPACCPTCFVKGRASLRAASSTDGQFVAEEVLAKHDENYMPPEVKESLKPHLDAAAGAAATPPPGST